MSAQSFPGYTGMIDHAPRWTWRLVIVAGVLSLAFLLVLPFMESLERPAPKAQILRPAAPVAVMPQAPDTRPETRDSHREVQPSQLAEVLPPLPETLPPMRRIATLDMALSLQPGAIRFSANTRPVDVGGLSGLTEVFALEQLDVIPQSVNKLRPIYPASARARGIQGVVEVAFTVGPDGRATDIEIVSSDHGDLFVAATLRAVRKWKFSPGKIDGRAVPVRLLQRVTYQLEER